MKIVNLVLISTLFVSCFGGQDTPEGALRDYVTKISKSKVDRDFYLDRTAGKLKTAIENMDEEEFEDFNKLPNVKNAKVKVLSKTCDNDTCTLTYLVSYNIYENNKNAFETEVKKIAEMEKEGDEWKITDVSNLKTYIEAKDSINIPAQQ
jgi:hypothetical protein